MPKKPLTKIAVQSAKPGVQAYKISDEKGMFLLVTPSGGKLWRYKYRYQKKEKLMALGRYPEVSLKAAREARDAARVLISQGVDPMAERKKRKELTGDSFKSVAEEWRLGRQQVLAPKSFENITQRLQTYVYPNIGNRPIADIKAPEILQFIRSIEDKGHLTTAHRVLGNVNDVLRYAVAIGKTERNVASDIKGALKPKTKRHLAAITEPNEAASLLRKIDEYSGTPVVEAALKLAPLVFVRPIELRTAKWVDINFETSEWRYTISKTSTPHIVPLSRQAHSILKSLYPVTGTRAFVFPSQRRGSNPMSDNAILTALRKMGYAKSEMSGHGFRAMARTMLDEILGYRVDIIEHQLGHVPRDFQGRAYNRTKHLDERKIMMQAWADYLDKIKSER